MFFTFPFSYQQRHKHMILQIWSYGGSQPYISIHIATSCIMSQLFRSMGLSPNPLPSELGQSWGIIM